MDHEIAREKIGDSDTVTSSYFFVEQSRHVDVQMVISPLHTNICASVLLTEPGVEAFKTHCDVSENQ
jgi:hypothetical protein